MANNKQQNNVKNRKASKTEGKTAPDRDKVAVDVSNSTNTLSKQQRKYSWISLNSVVIAVVVVGALISLFAMDQENLQSILIFKSGNRMKHLVNNNSTTTVGIEGDQCLSRSPSGECISNADLFSAIQSDDDVELGASSVIVPKGANPEGKPREAIKDCIDRYPKDCLQFVKQGECSRNPGWMIINCARSCNVCHLRDPTLRCARRNLNMSEAPIYRPGDMESMFSSLESRFGQRYKIEVLSRSPWVVTFENFLTEREAQALITTVKKWERSTDSGLTNEFGETGRILSNGRTSSNSWCIGECEDHPDVQSILGKIETITGVPRVNYESFQVLKYELGQKYNVHHDYGAEDVKLACGPRILTFFFYLSDVEEGGETAFPSLGIAVKPRKGKALLWPSTLSDFPENQDTRTFHEARPVIRGTKFAANSWIHMYDYETPNLWGCTGSFDEL